MQTLSRIRTGFNQQGGNTRKIIALTLVCIIYAEWLPFFVQIAMNFMIVDMRDVSIQDWLLIAAIISPPFVVFVFSLLALKLRKFLMASLKYLIPILFIVVAIGNWLIFMSYYQYLGFATPTFEELPSMTEIAGLHAIFSPHVKMFMLGSNIANFAVLVPSLLLYGSDCKGFINIRFNTKFMLIALGLYMFFRIGGIIGAPFRLAILLIVGFAFWTLNLGNSAEHSDNQKKIERNIRNETNDTAYIPILAAGGLFLMFGLWIGGPSMFINGLLYNTWVWIFLIVGNIIGYTVSTRLREAQTLKVGYIVIILIGALGILTLIAGMYSILISGLSVMLSLGLLMIGVVAWIPDVLMLSNRKNWFIESPLRFLLLYFMFYLGLIISFASGAAQPLSNMIAVGVYVPFFVLSILIITFALFKSLRKRK